MPATRYTSPVRPCVILRHVLLGAYLYVTLAAFLFAFTINTVRLPGIPYRVLLWAYGMMAPYQGDDEWNGALRVEARGPDSAWQTIDIARYMPYGFGERNAREFFRVFEVGGEDAQKEKVTEFARQLLEREQARGMPYRAIRISFEKWPRSPGGFEQLRLEPFIQRTFLTQVP
jgi:hypothetical protein